MKKLLVIFTTVLSLSCQIVHKKMKEQNEIKLKMGKDGLFNKIDNETIKPNIYKLENYNKLSKNILTTKIAQLDRIVDDLAIKYDKNCLCFLNCCKNKEQIKKYKDDIDLALDKTGLKAPIKRNIILPKTYWKIFSCCYISCLGLGICSFFLGKTSLVYGIFGTGLSGFFMAKIPCLCFLKTKFCISHYNTEEYVNLTNSNMDSVNDSDINEGLELIINADESFTKFKDFPKSMCLSINKQDED